MRYDALVIGGGPAGASLAIQLAQAGRAVVLFEKEHGPHDKVCGEFISPEGAQYLGYLGVSPEALGGVPIDYVRFARKGQAVTSKLPFQAHSLSRKTLDEALLRRAADAGAEVRRGSKVKALIKGDAEWTAELESGSLVRGADAFLATGKHDLKGWKRPAGLQPDLIGFKCHWRLREDQATALQNSVELMLFPGGYAGLEEVEARRANLCLLVRKSVFARYKSWDALLAGIMAACPHLATRLDGAAPLHDRALAITGLPYGYVCNESYGLWRLGDQAAVIPSFSGDGVSIALHSASLAARFYLSGRSAADFQKRVSNDVLRQVMNATAISKALVQPMGQQTAAAIAHAFPKILPFAARLTRIPRHALVQPAQ